MRHQGPATMWLSLALLAAMAGCTLANSTATLTPSQTEQAQQWVRQLSHRSFKMREEASRKLEELGKAGIKVLEEGIAKSDDMEAKRRCERLLATAMRSDTEVALELFLANKDSSKLMKLPSWERYSKMMGKDDAAKNLFVDMYCVEGSLLAVLDRDPKSFQTKFTAHVQEIQRNLYTPFGQANPISHHRVLSLLFMATDPNAGKDVQTFYLLNNLFYQQSVQQGFKESAGSRKLLMAYLEQRNTPQTSQQIFYVAKNLGLKEAMPMAVKMVNDKTVQGYTRGMALLFIGQLGGKEYTKEIEKLLTDTTTLGTLRTGNVTINAQMRDVALASLILLSGQQLSDYQFPYLQQIRGVRNDLNLPPYYYGFSDDAGRTAALKKWKDTQTAKDAPKN